MFLISNSDVINSGASSVGPIISNHYIATSFNNLYNGVANYGISDHNNSRLVCIRNKDIATVANFKTWLGSHNTTVYYALATPTDTQITDAALVGQLNAIDSAVLPKPVAYITVGATDPNLPAPIKISYYGENA